MVCTKRGNQSKDCPGKAKYEKESGKIYIYQKCNNNNEKHNKIDFEEFKDSYYKKQYNKLNMNKIIFQKFYIKCLVLDNKITNYTDAIFNFKKDFKDINFLLTKDDVNYIKNANTENTNNLTIEELTKSLKTFREDIIIDIYPINTEYKNSNNILENREQNIIIISTKETISYFKSSKQFGLDLTFKIIPISYKPYKLMSIYAIDKETNKIVIVCFILLKYKDANSLKKIFTLLRAMYYFEPITINTDFDFSQIKAIKECEIFKKCPYIICCLFHFSQSIIKKMKELKLIKKKLNVRGYEILRNLEVLCFIKNSKLKEYYEYLAKIINNNEKEKN